MQGWEGFDPEFDTRIRALATAAREAGFDPRITSGFRLPQDQARAIDSVSRNVYGRPATMVEFSRGIPGYAAPVGGSRHQDGIAADWASGPALQWLRANAPRFGVRFPEALAKTDPIHSELDQKFYGPVQDPRARENVPVPLFETGRPGKDAPPQPAPPVPGRGPVMTGSVPSAPQTQGATAPMAQAQPSGLFGLLQGLQRGMTSPLFQSGAAMYSAASQGKDIGTGFLMGGEAASRASKGQLEQAKMQRELDAQGLRDQMWQQLASGQTPAWAADLPAGTLDLARALGPDAGSQLLTQMVMAKPGRDESAARLKLAQNADARAAELQPFQIAAATRREEPAIVQTLRAAGVNPNSPQGQQLILNSIKGGSPIDQAIAGMIAPQAQTAPAPSPIQPQSFTPDGTPPGIQLTAGPEAIVPAQAPQAAPAQSNMIDTPFGPKTPEEARRLGFALALGGKGDAGKMLVESVDKDQMSKEARNQLDKKNFDTIEQAARLDNIARQFKPEYQTWETAGEMAFTKLMDSFDMTRGMVDPAKAQKFEDYTQFRQTAVNNLNRWISEITGAAMGVEEAKRLRAGMPDPETDSPRQFAAKLKNSVRESKLALGRYNYLRRNGFQGSSDQMVDAMSLTAFRDLYDRRGDEIANEIRRANPNIQPNDLKGAVGITLKREFGI